MITRRKALTILAGAAILPGLSARASASTFQWTGIALGAQARIILDHPNAEALVLSAVNEIRRLENIFSLYQADSQLSRLNREGSLRDPAFEMVELLSICSALNARTHGAFDPTVQTLWSLYARMASQSGTPTRDQIAKARSVTGWDRVRFSGEQVDFQHPEMALTLNGIAQGFIADKVADLFRNNGVHNVMVNTGEISALGTAPDGQDWQVELANSHGKGISLHDAAIATSRPLGTVFDQAGNIGHIIDPRTGYPGGKWSQVSVISEFAAQADGLSTAFCLMSNSEIAVAKGNSRVLLQ